MDHHRFSSAQSILAGTAVAEDGYVYGTIVGDHCKDSVPFVVEVLDKALTSPLCPPALRRECLVALLNICATHEILPSRCLLVGNLIVDYGSTICVRGAYERCGTLGELAVTVRSTPFDSAVSLDGSQENTYREIIIWKNLNHQNILPLLGVEPSILSFSTVSERSEYGTLRDYLVHFPNASRVKLLLDASQGLEYLHGLDCIHGDLKSHNILVNSDRSAVLAGFQSASFLPKSGADTGVSASECDPCSVRWLAPELLFPKKFGLQSVQHTKESDVYAFAMVMYEVFSGSFPFEGHRNETVILLVRSGDHPCRPENGPDLGLTDELWNTMKACWKRRDRRWETSRIVSILKRHSAAAAAATK